MTKVVRMKGRGDAGAESVAEGSPAESGEKRDYHRIPWSGNLDENELGRPGGLLLAALIRCANERRQQLNDMARELGVTYGYINQLRNGIRQVNQVSDDFALGCARYLGVPRMTVLMMAGRVSPEDLFEHREMMAAEIGRAMAFMVDDPQWGHQVTPELRQASVESQYLLVRLYEEATGKRLMDKHLNADTLAQEIGKLREIQAARARSLESYTGRKTQEG